MAFFPPPLRSSVNNATGTPSHPMTFLPPPLRSSVKNATGTPKGCQ